MQLRHLRYFVAAAEEENFGRASERLHVTRPAVSQIIADLERELGTPVFERLGHGVRLTAAGRALLPELKRITNDVDEAMALARRVSQGKSGRLDIGYGALTLMHSLFCQAVKGYHQVCPDVTLALLELPGADLPCALAEKRIDGAFMHFGPARTLPGKDGSLPSWGTLDRKDLTLEWVPIQTSRVGIVVPLDHQLAQRNSVSLADLACEDLVDAPRSSSSLRQGAIRKMCQNAGFEPRVVQEVETVPALLNLVSARVGIGFAVSGANFTYPAGLRVVPLSDVPEPATFVFAWTKQRGSPALDRMIDVIRALAPALLRAREPIRISRARSSSAS
jgi:DNA-binding transcriptional LysR family regulator